MVQLIGQFNYNRVNRVEDFVEEEYGPLTKRSRFTTAPLNQVQWGYGQQDFSVLPPQYNPLDEPSPLGLRLKKSPSLVDLIQRKLSQGSSASVSTVRGPNDNSENKNEGKETSSSSASDKVKASNFPASLLRIGSWEYLSKYEGDLVAKFYFAKHKLVWEVLEDGLKSKIEIQWSDIMTLKSECPDDGPGSFTLVLDRKPTFYRETNPQPRKHTLWEATDDFTNGQASVHRQHYIQCPQGILEKHYEKLIQCDERLRMLSLQFKKFMCSLYFESQDSVLEKPGQSKGAVCDQLQDPAKGTPSALFVDAATATADQLSFYTLENNPVAAQLLSSDVPLPSSVMDTHEIQRNIMLDECSSEGRRSWESSEVPGIRPSLSLTDIMNNFASCISGQTTSGSLPSEKASKSHDMLENIAQVMLSDTQITTGLDERSLMKKVDSLCSLLQDPVPTSNAQVGVGNHYESANHGSNVSYDLANNFMNERACNIMQGSEGYFADGLGGNQAPAIPRRDSLGDLLLHLPRIASVPRFLFDIDENNKYQAM